MPDDMIGEIGENNRETIAPSIPDIPDSAGKIIGLGIDIVERERVGMMLEKHGERFLERCFTKGEVEYCMSRRDPVPDLAVRLAAKEAGFKAIGARRGMGIGWRDFETVLDKDSVPFFRLLGKAKSRGESIGVREIWMSLTHEDLWAAAVIIVTV